MQSITNSDRGAGVMLAQGVLHRLGFTIQNMDGAFGPETERALREYQTARGLSVDGKLGTQTVNTLISDLWDLSDPESEGAASV